MISGAFDCEDGPLWTVSVRISDPELEAKILEQLDTIPEIEIRHGGAMLIVTDRIEALAPGTISIVLGEGPDVAAALQAGAAAVLPPNVARDALRATLGAVMHGLAVVERANAGAAFDPPSRSPPPEQCHAPHLTSRELEVLAALAEGASNKEIARRLGISPRTVKFHVASILEKLDATGRTDAVAHAVRLGLVML